VLPAAIDAVAGVTAIETKTAGVTLRVALGEVTPLCDAVIALDPFAMPVAKPAELIVAVEALDEFQITLFVKFCVV
jgi:hypothetical protein